MTYQITNTFLETPDTLLVWALFSNNTDRSFRFPLTATYADIIKRLDEEVAMLEQNELDRLAALERIQEEITDGSIS